MNWLGHHDSDMIRHYYHLHDEEARRRMDQLDFFVTADGRPVGAVNSSQTEETSSRNPAVDEPVEAN